MVWAREKSEGFVERHWGDEWASGIRCPFCSGFWLSCAVVGITWAVAPLPLPGLWFPAVSSVVALLAHYSEL